MTSRSQFHPVDYWYLPCWRSIEFWVKYALWETVVVSSLLENKATHLSVLHWALGGLCVIAPIVSALAMARNHAVVRRTLSTREDLDQESRLKAIDRCLVSFTGMRWEAFVVITTLWILTMIGR